VWQEQWARGKERYAQSFLVGCSGAERKALFCLIAMQNKKL
jgi:hypothetical protein